MPRRPRLTKGMTETEFEHGYWYAAELKAFARKVGVPSAGRMRKDELEAAMRRFFRTGETASVVTRGFVKSGARDVDKGLRLDLAVVNYTSSKETKDFIEREAARLEPGFRRVAGTRYLLNRWREEQVRAGRRITYGDLVKQAILLNKTKRGPLRVVHGRYINFISDFMAGNKGAPMAEAVTAWHEVKSMNTTKTYEAWARPRGRRASSP